VRRRGSDFGADEVTNRRRRNAVNTRLTRPLSITVSEMIW
jgi:hypothetical protein